MSQSNRYELLCDWEEMDPPIQDLSFKKKTDAHGKISDSGYKSLQSKDEEVPPKPDVKNKLSTKTSVQHSREDNTKHKNAEESTRQNKNNSEVDSIQEKGDEWTETHKKEKIRSHKGRGGLPRRDPFNNRGKREFDRLSGSQKSGVKPVEKRDGGGARNWGRLNDNYEILQEEEQNTDVTAENAEAKDLKTESKPSKPDNSVKEMTLDEWKEHTKNQSAPPAYNLRKAGEGTDQKQWNRFQILKKKTQEDISHEDVAQNHSTQPRMASKAFNPVNVLFSSESFTSHHQTRPFGRGGRRGPKAISQPSADVKEASPSFSETDFPSLGGT